MGHLHHRHVHPHANVEKRQDALEDGIAMVAEVVFVTAPKTFEGPATFITPGNPETSPSFILAPPIQAQTTNTPVIQTTRHTELDPQRPTTSVSSQTRPKQTPTRKPTTMVQSTSRQTSVPTQRTRIVNANQNFSTTSSVDASSATASVDSSSATTGGISGGVIAGIAIGLGLALIALIAALIMLKRRKNKTKGMERLDDEKSPFNEKTPIITAPALTATPSVRTARSHEPAPRLSLRAVSSFSPILNNGNDGGKQEMTQNGLLAPGAPSSAWERRGAQNDPANPFGSHAEKSHSPEPRHLKTDSFAIMGGKLPDSGRVTPPEHQQQHPPQSPTAPSIRSVSSGGSAASGFTEASEAPSAIVGGAAPGAPGGPAPPPSNVHRVQMDFQPTMDDELEVRAGQLVRILHNYDDGWALCIRMDRSQQGVVPRSCLSKHPLKPRKGGRPKGPPQGMRGPPPPFAAQPRPLSPGGRNSPGPHGRPMSPAGRGPPPPFAGPGPRPQSPLSGPRGPPRGGPGPRPRAGTAGGPGPAPYGGPPRSMSPGPYGYGGQRPDQPAMRRRSNSVGDLAPRRQSPPAGPSPMNPNGGVPARKPVPGQAM